MDNETLIKTVVQSQVSTIIAQRRFANFPGGALSMPARTPGQRSKDDELWAQVIERGLIEQVNKEVERLVHPAA